MFPSAEPMHIQLEKRQLEKLAISGDRAHRGLRLFYFHLPRLKRGSRPVALKPQHNSK